MARVIPDSRFEELIRAATEVFITHGYRRTQMADVAEAMGLAKGTVYLYVESKEALFDLVVRQANRQRPAELPKELPIRTPKPGSTVAYVAGALGGAQQFPQLQAALERARPRDVREEFEGILRELFRLLHLNRTALKLIDRCAADHPELAALWFKRGREFLLEWLVRYFERRKGHLRPQLDLAIAARMVIENLVLWAVHRYWDPAPQKMDDAIAEDTVVRVLLDGLVKE
jgi:AcrR family transcriptional regulator